MCGYLCVHARCSFRPLVRVCVCVCVCILQAPHWRICDAYLLAILAELQPRGVDEKVSVVLMLPPSPKPLLARSVLLVSFALRSGQRQDAGIETTHRIQHLSVAYPIPLAMAMADSSFAGLLSLDPFLR